MVTIMPCVCCTFFGQVGLQKHWRAWGILKRLQNDVFRVAGAVILRFVMLMFEASNAESVEGLQILCYGSGTLQFFFPASADWPVWPGQSTVLSRKRERSCTGLFNWGGAHCTGENVKQRTGPFLQKSLEKQTQTNQQQNGHSPPRQPGTPRPGSQVHGPRSNKQRERKRPQRQIQVRLNVHRNALNDALIQ